MWTPGLSVEYPSAPKAPGIYTLEWLQEIYVDFNICKVATSFLLARFFRKNTIPVTGSIDNKICSKVRTIYFRQAGFQFSETAF